MFKKTLTVLMVLALPVLAFGTTEYQADGTPKPVRVITDADIGPFNYWTSDTVYNLDGFVYVEDGEILMVEPGTIIKGNPGEAENATALIVARGGKIYAMGTACDPIVFTSISDDVDDPFDIPLNDDLGRGLWGGLLMLGKAILPGTDTAAGIIREGQIEGIPETEPRGAYGGQDNMDNSGVLKYVSVRHGGSEIGAANEINGVTMGAVGAGTVMDYVEVTHNLDDGFEWFGGTVSAYHLVVDMVGDDCFDMDEGYRGSGQFWFAIHEENAGDRSGEHDGTWGGELGTCPRSSAVVSNATYIGRGAANGGQRAFELRDNMSGGYYNSIITEHGTYGLNVEDDPAGSTLDNLKNGNLKLHNNVWYGFGNGNSSSAIANGVNPVDTILFYDYDPSTYWLGGGTAPISGTRNNMNYLSTTDVVANAGHNPGDNIDPRPANEGSWYLNDGTAAWSWVDPLDPDDFIGYNPDVTDPDACIDDGWLRAYEAVDYAGAFDPNEDRLWIHDWTALDQYGYLYDNAVADCDCPTDDEKPVKVVTDADITEWTYFSNDTVYNLDGFCYVEDGETLVIEPGTVVKGNPGQAENATALVVAQGGQIYALGSNCCPIVFTAISDDVDDPFDIPLDDDLGRGLWGGVIMLGNATICDTLEGHIEGIPETEPRGAYGGSDDCDNSGVLRFVSIRHGGSEIGAANEINGLTMGGVGAGTRISHVEVFMNLDDGFEWFGGSVAVDHLVAAFVGDDAFDYDECWHTAPLACGDEVRRGHQYMFAVHGTTGGDRSGEHDGGYGSDVGACPVTTPLFSNATYIGAGTDSDQRCFEIRDAAGGGYWNSVFTDHGTYGLNVEQKVPEEDVDSRQRLYWDQLRFYNNIWYGFGNGNTSADIANNVNDVDSILFYTFDVQQYVPSHPMSLDINHHNYLSIAQVVRNIDRGQNGQLDPRVACIDNTFLNDSTGVSWTEWVDPNTDDLVKGYHWWHHDDPFCGEDSVTYESIVAEDFPGAFDPNLPHDKWWTTGWAFLDCGGYLGEAADPDCAGSCCDMRADINDNGTGPDVSDLVYLVTFMFSGGPEPPCMEEADINGNGTGPDVSDLVYLVTFMFSGGPAPIPCP